MIAVDAKFSDTAKRVAYFPPNNPKHTSFSISKKMKDSNRYENYKFVAWNEILDIAEGDKVIFKRIDSIKPSYYGDKLTIEITGLIEIEHCADTPYAEDDTFPTSLDDVVSTAPKVTETDFFADADDTALPFNL